MIEMTSESEIVFGSCIKQQTYKLINQKRMLWLLLLSNEQLNNEKMSNKTDNVVDSISIKKM